MQSKKQEQQYPQWAVYAAVGILAFLVLMTIVNSGPPMDRKAKNASAPAAQLTQ